MRDVERRRQKDRERYEAHAEDRRAHQRAYYAANRERILKRRHEHGYDKVRIH